MKNSEKLKAIRLILGLNQIEMAEKLGCSQAWVWKTENGKVEATNDYQRAAVDLLRANQSRVVEIITMCAALIEPSGKVS